MVFNQNFDALEGGEEKDRRTEQLKEAFVFMASRERDWQLLQLNYGESMSISNIFQQELKKVP